MNSITVPAGIAIALVVQASAEPFRFDRPAGPQFGEAEKAEQFARGSNVAPIELAGCTNVLVRGNLQAESPQHGSSNDWTFTVRSFQSLGFL